MDAEERRQSELMYVINKIVYIQGEMEIAVQRRVGGDLGEKINIYKIFP